MLKSKPLLFSVITGIGIACGSLTSLILSSSEAHACKSGLGKIDPTCSGRILNPSHVPKSQRPSLGNPSTERVAFDAKFYLNQYPDLRKAFGNDLSAATRHWVDYGITEGRESAPVFNARFYLNKYPDLQQAFGANNYAKAVQHWVENGVREGRQGSQNFDPRYYLDSNPDVAKAKGAQNYEGAIRHYLDAGIREGRRGAR